MNLKDKNAIIYGAGGGIGGGVARAFAREGARVFLVGRTRQKLEAVAADINAAGGQAEVAMVDATNEQAVNDHVRQVAARAGRVDISINLTSHGDVYASGYLQGVPLTEISAADFFLPINKGVLSNYITAQAAARQMVQQKSGVILTLINAGAPGGTPLMGSTGVAAAAIESFTRTLAAEVGQFGVRVLGIHIAAVLERLQAMDLHTDVFEKESGGLNSAGIIAAISNMSMLRRVTTLAQVVDAIAFLASDSAGGMTGTFINVTSGMVSD
jgi:NAD(P)-dependent dehydrogenase (short-subunit alcohol dehydrogenase family)